MTSDEAKRRWEQAEHAAVQAETKVAAIGHAAAHPRVGEMLREASELRQEADRLLREWIEADRRDREDG